jgi:hypothetical protein
MNTLIWGVSWAVVGWLLGILLLFVGGLLFLPFDADRRNDIANYYSSLAMKLLGRGALVESGVKYDIYRTENAPDKNSDTMSIDGETAEVTNTTGALSTLHKKPFGLVPPPEDNVAEYVYPEFAEIGKLEKERIERDDYRDEDGNYIETMTLADKRPTSKLREYASFMIPNNRSLWDLSETVELYKQSQSLFGESKTTQFMILIIAYGIGALLTWLIVTNAGGTVPTDSINLPMVMLP